MWPAKIEKVAKDSTGKSKVYVKYFELNPKTANLFKMEPSKVEPFFRPVKEHFQYKVGVKLFLSLSSSFHSN